METITTRGARSSGVAVPSWPLLTARRSHCSHRLRRRHIHRSVTSIMNMKSAKTASASAAGPSRPGAACSIRRGCRMRRSFPYAAQHLTSIEVNGTFYRTQSAGELPQMGRRSAGRLRVLAEGPALCGESPRARGSRRLHQALPAFRPARARRQARSAAVAIRADQEIRRGRFRKISRIAARRRSTAARSAMSSKCAMTAFGTPAFIKPAAAIPHPDRCTPSTRPTRNRRPHRRFRLCAAAEGRGEDDDRLSAEALAAWAGRCRAGPRATSRRT